MKKILVMLTNVSQYGEEKEKTGLWLAEACEFVYDVQKAGFEVDYASVNGGTVPLDPRSMKKFIDLKKWMKCMNLKTFKIER
ncbi:type 1 glutamine amidotransferase domain-containing protein [Enterococcus cecorum]|nr:type 1 glutamine amidotransferase domain-containing protein [Enterococcus cecorum]CAI3252846.1 type 1 glutamine amidotransferase domain-containing protein [Enterococcus cecorum]CAI3253222.1 type 1 glutamine amidotransferase domain-containing protein [Enterococcus cecorum]CAI3253430.1 type 1 glutamine amidotransferase domain-containing protein [Enterococcus cecorum]CAI3254174.1 type 1 glutamine amidotransferase domain-containing protein [Enterococcus cecorum]